MPLESRTFRCEHCGFEIDRDLNAAINLENYPITAEGLTVEACRGVVAPSRRVG